MYQPTTGAVLCECANATAEDVDLAVAAAKASLYSENWGNFMSSSGGFRCCFNCLKYRL